MNTGCIELMSVANVCMSLGGFIATMVFVAIASSLVTLAVVRA